MESLLLFRRALSSPTMCRFIPALSVPGHLVPGRPANQSGSNLHLAISFIGARYTIAAPWSNRPRRELVDENPAVEDSAYLLGFPAPDGEAADGRHASDHARSPIYRAAAPRCLSKKALISPKASFVSGA